MTLTSCWWSFMLPGKVVSISCVQILVRPILYPLPRMPGETEDRPRHVRQSQPRSRLVPSAHCAAGEVGSAGRGGFTESLLGNRMRLKLPPSCPAKRNVMAFLIAYPTSGFHAVFLGASLAWWISPGHPGMQTRCVHFP